MTLSIMGGRLKINLLLIPAAAAALYTAGIEFFSAFVLSLVLHEFSHALAARAVGAGIISVELLPFGCAANLDTLTLTGGKEAAVAMAGPLANIAAAALIKLLFSGGFAETLMRANTSIAAVNLLPALPLDGGRVMRAALSLVMRETSAQRVTGLLGVLAGAAFLCAGVYFSITEKINISFIVFGGFMVYASVKSVKSAGLSYAVKASEKRRAIKNSSFYPVNQIAAGGNRRLCDVLTHLDPNKYNIVHIVDGDLMTRRTIDEGEIMRLLISEGADTKI